MKCLKIAFTGLLLAGTSTWSYSQSLNEKYEALIEKSETYAQYKVIPKTSLDSFWGEAMDSMSAQNDLIAQLRSEVANQNQQIEALTQGRDAVQTKLDESLSQNDSISFLGISFTKLSYHLIVWSLIFVLAGFGVIAYTLFFRSNKLTIRHKKDFDELEAEFEKHRNSAREKQVKLKRELQTAVNKLESKGKALS